MHDRRIIVCDKPFESIKGGSFDWLILAVGSESRCCHVARLLFEVNNCTIGNILVLCYPDVKKSVVKKFQGQLARLCCNKSNIKVMEVESDSHEGIYDILDVRFNSNENKDCSILVDYSCMSRVWYAALLYWFYLQRKACDHLSFMFLYAKGKYTKSFAGRDVVIGEICPVPGCAGISSRQANTVAIFCLGFFGYMSLCVYDELEPNDIYTISTIEKPLRGFSIERQPGNKELIERAAKPLRISVCSVEGAFRQMMEIAKYRQLKGENVTIVPMGPKPHILASILVALANHDVCVMRVRHDQYTSDVTPAGEIIATEVKFVDINYEDK